MPLDQEGIAQHEAQLAAQRSRLAYLFKQQAALGAYTPPYVILDMEQTQAGIRSLKALLRESGAPAEDLPGDERPIPAPAEQSPARRRLRAPVADFVGRAAEIDQLVTALAAGEGATIRGLRGIGGIGKTELALAVAHRLLGVYPDQILIELRGASNPVAPSQALQTAIHAFEREARLPDDLNELRNIYAAVLAGRRVLILADDAKDAAQARALLPPAGCALLVTSRSRFSLPGMAALDLSTLPPADAEALLREICPRVGARAPDLARLCGCLPLALRVSASLLANSPRPVERYLAQLQAERLKHLADPDTPDDPQASVEASLRLSYDALPPEAQQALAQLGVFPAGFDQPAALAVVEVEGDAEAALDLLQRRCLLDQDATTQRLSLHDLARAFALARLEDADAARLRHARHYARVAWQAGGELYNQGGVQLLAGLALFDWERAQIDAGWGWAMMRAGEPPADALLRDYANATVYIGDLRYDKRRERIPQLEAALAAARRTGDREAEGAWLGNLGLAYDALGDARQAIGYYEHQLEIAREIGDRRGEGNALGNLGIAYDALGDARRAIGYHEQNVAVAREIGDRRGEGAALGNLGLAYDALGDVRQAIGYYEQQLEIVREIGDRRGEGAALGNLAGAYYTLGNAQQARTYYEQRLVVAREIGDRRGEGNALSGLGLIYYALGDARRAIGYHEQHLAVVRELGDRRGEGAALGNLGNAYKNLGDARQALGYHEQHLAVAREIGDRRGEGNALGNLGIAYDVLGDVRQAIGYYEQQLEIVREIGDRVGEGIASWNLGLALEKEGDLARAAELMQVRVDFLRELGHPDAEKRAARLEEVRRRLAGGAAGAE